MQYFCNDILCAFTFIHNPLATFLNFQCKLKESLSDHMVIFVVERMQWQFFRHSIRDSHLLLEACKMDGKQNDLVSSKWGTQADQPSYHYCTSLHLQCTQINNNVLKYLSSYIFPTLIKLKFLFKTSVNKVSISIMAYKSIFPLEKLQFISFSIHEQVVFCPLT